MSAITTKSTKAEILAAYNELSEEFWSVHQAATSQTVTWPAIVNTARVVRREFFSLCQDVYNAGTFCRKASQPLIDKAILIVKN